MSVCEQLHIRRIGPAQDLDAVESVVTESPLSIRINDSHLSTLMCTPLDLDYLVTGYLLSAGVIDSADDIDATRINVPDGIAAVRVPGYDSDGMPAGALVSGCGRGEIYLDVISHCTRNDNDSKYSASELLGQMSVFNKSSELFLATGGVHSAALSTGKEIIFMHEDIGRHNAVDKVIGHAACSGVSLSDKVLLTSGRLSSEILIKAAKRGLPVVVSRSAPTTLAVELATRLNITLIGFARGNRMNIYAGESRIDA